MSKRFMAIWFRYLRTDWFIRRQPSLRQSAFVLATPDHGRMVVTAASEPAQARGVQEGMTVADARVLITGIQVLEDQPDLPVKLLTGIAGWCIRYTPVTAIDPPDGLLLDITGCAHLWGSESSYLADILQRLNKIGYHVKAAIGDTVGTAWAIARYGQAMTIIEPGQQMAALMTLPPVALRLEAEIIERLEKLGLRQINRFISMPRTALRRRFGPQLLLRLGQALGYEEEALTPVQPIELYQERLPSIDPIVTATGIEIALQRLLDILCLRLQREEKGLRLATLKCYRTDGKIELIAIGTNRPSCNARHIFKLFEIKIDSITPADGIELFVLAASKVEAVSPVQEQLWENNGGLDNMELAELLDRVEVRLGADRVHRYLPAEHYWPERSFRGASAMDEPLSAGWRNDKPRPLQLLSEPALIYVSAPVPDYPPMLFRYQGKLHTIVKADGPERIEAEWWLQTGEHRDYYCVEDEAGQRYWLFRSGHYQERNLDQWFIHGFFA